MDRTPVSSSNVLSIGYDSEKMVLEIEFVSGLVYEYYDVPIHIYENLLASDSIGGFLHHHVKGFFSYSQV